MNRAMIPLLMFGALGGGMAEAREPEPPLDPEEEARREAERQEHARLAAEHEVRREARRAELLAAGHVPACAGPMARFGHKCSCPAPFARVPEPAAVSEGHTAADRVRIQAAIDKRARKAARKVRRG